MNFQNGTKILTSLTFGCPSYDSNETSQTNITEPP